MTGDAPESPQSLVEPVRGRLWPPRLLAGALFLLALWAGVSGARWGIANLTNDDGTYWGTALALEAGRGYTMDFSPVQAAVDRFPPGWPLLLAAVMRVFGRGEEAILAGQVLNLLLWASALGLAYLTLARRAGRPLWLAWGGLVFLAVHPLALETVSLLMSEPLTVFLLTVGLLMWLRQPAGIDLGMLGLIVGYAFVTRYAVLPVLAALALATILRLRAGAWPLLLGMALPSLCWGLWWMAFRGDGYVTQAVYWSAAELWMQVGSLILSLGRTFLQALPSIAWPGLYLARFPQDTDVPWTQPFLLVLALAIDFLIVRMVIRVHRRRMAAPGMVWGLLAYGILVTLWQSAFLNLKEHLPFRLLLPVLPVVVVLVGEQIEEAIQTSRKLVRNLAIAGLVLTSLSLVDALRAVGQVRIYSLRSQQEAFFAMDQTRMDRARFPRKARVATDFGGMYYQATGEKAFALTGGIDPVGLERNVMGAGVDLFFTLMSPRKPLGGVDHWWGVGYLNGRYPGLVVPAMRADGRPTSWTQVDRRAWARYRRKLLLGQKG